MLVSVEGWCRSRQSRPVRVKAVPAMSGGGGGRLFVCAAAVFEALRCLPVRRLAYVVPRHRTSRCDSVPRAADHGDIDPHAVRRRVHWGGVMPATPPGLRRSSMVPGWPDAGLSEKVRRVPVVNSTWGSMTPVSSPVNMFLDTLCLIVGCGDRKCGNSVGLRPVKKNSNSPGFGVRLGRWTGDRRRIGRTRRADTGSKSCILRGLRHDRHRWDGRAGRMGDRKRRKGRGL